MIGFIVEVRDKALARLGQIRPEDLSLTFTDRFNNVGEWQLLLSTTHPMTPALRTPGAGIIVTRDDGVTMFSGPVVTPESSASSGDSAGTVTVTGVTDSVILADRLGFPQPSNTDPNTQTVSHDVRTGTVEALMHAYVNANIGPSAPAARRDSRLTMGTNLGRGPTTTKRARFPKLGSLLAELASGANLGFRVVQVGSALQFQTFAVADRSADVRFDIYNGTLTSHKVSISPPGATRVIVAGPGEAEDRTFASVSTAESVAAETAWGRRIELFLDKRGEDAGALTQAGLEKLAETGFASTAVQAVPADDTTWEFGTDWNLGDRVSIVVENAELASVVTGYTLKADQNGTRLGALLGDPDGFTSDTSGRLVGVERRVGNLEANAEGGFSIDKVYPVGAIYLSALATDPGTLFGGTWSQLQNRFLVGVGSTYPTPLATGGAATVTLATGNLPSHTHGVGTLTAANESGHTHASGGLGTDSQGAHTHGLGRDKSGATGTGEYISHSTGITGAAGIYYNAMTTDGAHGHNLSGSTAAGSAHTHTLSGATASAGSGTAFSIIPPYLAVYMWQRTA